MLLRTLTIILIILLAATIFLYTKVSKKTANETQQLVKDSADTEKANAYIKHNDPGEKQQHISIRGAVIAMLDSFAVWHGLKLKFVGDKPLKRTIELGIHKPGNLHQELRMIKDYVNESSNEQEDFAYWIKDDTLIVDNYYHYSIDTKKPKPQTAFIKSYYDSARKSKVLAFQNISPRAILDTMLVTYNKHEINKTHNKETVSGLLPLAMGLKKMQAITFDKHGWVFDKNHKAIVNSETGKIQIIE